MNRLNTSRAPRPPAVLPGPDRRRDNRRPVQSRAVLTVMRLAEVDEDKAFACLRAAAMERRMTVEAFCAAADEANLRALLPWRLQGGGFGRA